MTFLETEKSRYERVKPTADWLSEAARANGEYRGRARAFCIPEEHAAENLFVGTRERVIEYFAHNQIKWHDGTAAGPSNHLCSSMVCGVNFLSPLMDNAEAATTFLRGVFDEEVVRSVPVADEPHVEFEWVGDPNEDYLNEGLNRTRGANATSADAAMAYLRPDGGKTLVLIEWKYTESYSTDYKGAGEQGKTRRRRYEELFNAPESPFDGQKVSYDETLYEPFYQFMRQQLLAWRMEAKGLEHGADRVRVLHLSPSANTDFEKVTAPALAARHEGRKSTRLWQSLLVDRGRFTPVSVETAFARLLTESRAELAEWREYVANRYPWTMTQEEG
jgi:hypothetical protein